MKRLSIAFFFLLFSSFLFANQFRISLPPLLVEQYQIEGSDLIDFFQFDIDGDDQQEAIWLIWHKNSFQLIYHNHKNRCGQYQLSGEWKRTQPPQLLFQNLDEQKGEEILIYDLNQQSPLMELLGFPHFEATTLFRHSQQPFFATQFSLSPNGNWILILHYQKRLLLPSKQQPASETSSSNPPELKTLSTHLVKTTIDGKESILQEWKGVIEKGEESWRLSTRWQLKNSGWLLLEAQID